MNDMTNTPNAIADPGQPDLTSSQVAMALPASSDELAELQPPQPIEKESFPHGVQGFMKVLPATLENIFHMLRHYGITVRYDTIKKKLRITIPGHTGTTDNADNTAITLIISLVTLNGMAIGQVPAVVEAIADRNLYNPVAEWISSRPWDGVDRLPELFETLRERDGFSPQLKRILIYKWLVSAAAAAILPRGFKARGVLTFQGPQGIGKTSWVMALVNDAQLKESVIKVDHLLDQWRHKRIDSDSSRAVRAIEKARRHSEVESPSGQANSGGRCRHARSQAQNAASLIFQVCTLGGRWVRISKSSMKVLKTEAVSVLGF